MPIRVIPTIVMRERVAAGLWNRPSDGVKSWATIAKLIEEVCWATIAKLIEEVYPSFAKDVKINPVLPWANGGRLQRRATPAPATGRPGFSAGHASDGPCSRAALDFASSDGPPWLFRGSCQQRRAMLAGRP